jgi:hypothetical protein
LRKQRNNRFLLNYTNTGIASIISSPDAQTEDKYLKHISEFNGEKKRFNDIGIKTREEYEASIIDDLNSDQTLVFVGDEGYHHYYNPEKNTYTGIDPHGKYNATHFRPSTGQKYIEKQFSDNAAPDSQIIEGGYKALRKHIEEMGGTISIPNEKTEAIKPHVFKEKDAADDYNTSVDFKPASNQGR